jgi:hypothetical protein
MSRILGALIIGLVLLPVRAGEAPSGCAWLCGNWFLDAGLSDPAEPLVDTALQKYKQPGPRRPQRPFPDDPLAPEGADAMPAAPAPEPPGKAALRSQLLAELAPPASLAMGQQPDGLVIRAAGGDERRVYPGEPHTLVDSRGTTKIKTAWKRDALVIKEARGRNRKFTETFTLLSDGNLQLTRVLVRPGLKEMRLRALYRRDQTQALESGAQGRPPDSAP